jgi:pyruvate dehydrogenase E2 component (dihydrolipoamide acetyltransferase)
VPVIEVFVKPGDTVKAEDALVTLESDKATMDVPAPFAGVVKELKVKVGDKVAEGTVLIRVEPPARRGRPCPRCRAPAPAPGACIPPRRPLRPLRLPPPVAWSKSRCRTSAISTPCPSSSCS